MSRKPSRARRWVIGAVAVVVALWLAAVWVGQSPDVHLSGERFEVGSERPNRVNWRWVEAGSRSDGTAYLKIGDDPMVTGLRAGDSVSSAWWGRLTIVRVESSGNPGEPGSGGGAVVRWSPW